MAAYRVPEHIWRTRDNRLVLTGDPDAAILAHARGEEMAEERARELGILDAVAGKPVRVSNDKPAAKPGVTINRRSSDKEN